ncbi:hypothetical protein RDWZM_009255 [Blomia tropicalis]|uniref:WD repeat-containing protein 36 n=1 Tax=Blomia tropicalis TaxID=40697 RepID=A0A9Q0M3S2_BLOTA|nr:hypothetical protein RDWZM_009255 [Blomia tropicalis]
MANPSQASRLFEGYRSLGLISSDVPHLIRYVETANKIQVITAVGRSFLVFNQKLQLLETCVAHSSDIQVLASDALHVYTASANQIFAWKFGHKWKVHSFLGAEQNVFILLPFGPHLLAVDRSNTLYVWETLTEKLTLSIPFSCNNTDKTQKESFEISTLLHPATYINKILIGSKQGSLQLWNISKQKLIYRFEGWKSAVTKLSQAPALHVVAIGHQSGLIVLHNLKEDQTLMKFYQEWGPVSDIAFRTDDAATMPILISSCSTNGHLAVWNLDEQRLEAQMRMAHSGPIVGAQFVSKQPLLVTNSSDNSLKVFLFDDLQISGRPLYEREGHHAPPTKIRFYGHLGHFIVSAGLDSSLRAFFIYSERKNLKFGTASIDSKATKNGHRSTLKPIVDFAFEPSREKEWDNVVAAHRDTSFVTTWNYDKKKISERRLLPERFARTKNAVRPECVSMTHCGNFALIGYSSGHVERFNIQSGIHRCSYGEPAHQGIVRGVVTDSLNQMVISGGADLRLNFWRFRHGEPIGSLSLSAPINRLHLHQENNLLAASLDNYHIVIIDLETKKVIRRFTAHTARITDLTMDADCRRMYVASMDSLIYVWDMITGSLIDCFRTVTPCVSLTLSPTGEFLATAHVNDLGIYLWANLSIYSMVSLSPIDIEHVRNNARLIEMPTIRSDEEVEVDQQNENDNTDANDIQIEQETIDFKYASPEQLSAELITLSALPSSRWKNLLKLDLIKKRNKPTEPVEKPKAVPFFLPTIAGLAPKFDLQVEETKSQDGQQNEARRFQLQFMSEFVRMLDRCDTVIDNDENESSTRQQLHTCFGEFKSYGPSKIDAELRMLGPESTGSNRYLHLFIDMIDFELQSNRDFELAQSYLSLFLKIHLDSIAADESLLTKCTSLSTISDKSWSRLSQDMDRSICLINYLRNALI